jgi:thiosulfate/3-mercaptopyruvate sulfurtransferase
VSGGSRALTQKNLPIQCRHSIIADGEARQMAQEPVSPLVSPEWLSRQLGRDDVLVLDIRSAVDGGGRAAFDSGHIPGAVHTDYVRDGWRVARGRAAGLLPDADARAALFGRLGVRPDHHVVIVPAGVSVGDFSAAARIYWTFKVAGHERLSILDGGVAAWTREPSRPIETGPGRPRPPSRYPVRCKEDARARLSDVERALARRSAALLDARSIDYFEGRAQSPAARAPGRLPGAIAFDQAKAYDAAANRLRPAADLSRIFAPVPDGAVISYCNTGQAAATNWFVLSELLGRPDVSLYDGSMSEWTEDPARAVEVGPPPRG